ncbi:cold-shock protein [Bradyrhizobium sp. UFLA03-84]|uniref:cold-shock protein n=1 Tax=Bradyrhizobium sp. UFLA03-84 TaxID=418599 RepID=UPI000BAE1A51|nr:cold shock domain-containing protein [Bradyrhizobium sp. UFLA03-84]PAY05444.1 cold-shock protein [Bradyrhizobium sp. UFLA03-84]
MATGTIKKWIDERGFGFVKPDDGGADVFLHISALPQGAQIEVGMRLSFEVAPDPRSGRTRARDVRLDCV